MTANVSARPQPRLTVAKIMAFVALAAVVAASWTNPYALLTVWICVHALFGTHLVFECLREGIRFAVGSLPEKATKRESLARWIGVIALINSVTAAGYIGWVPLGPSGFMLGWIVLLLTAVIAILTLIWCVALIWTYDVPATMSRGNPHQFGRVIAPSAADDT